MSVILYDNSRLDLPKFHKYQDRIDFIMDNILDNDIYCNHYNPYSGKTSQLGESQQERLLDRWLGVKVVGKSGSDESLKHFIDYLSGYVLRASEYSVNNLRNRYIKLIQQEVLTEDDINEIEAISKSIIYKDIDNRNIKNSLIFIENTAAEVSMESRLHELEFDRSRSYSEEFTYNDISYRLSRCKSIKDEVISLSVRMQEIIAEIRDIRTSIYDKSNHSDITASDVDLVLADVRQLKSKREETRDIKYKISELNRKYISYTELFTSTI